MKSIRINSFDELAVYKFTFPLIVIYEKPLDFPRHFVGRVWDLDQPTPFIFVGDTLEEVRAFVPENMALIERQPDDDPAIIENWV